MNTIFSVKKEICEVGRRIYNRGFVAANDGNISVRVDKDRIICTPTGVSKGYISEDMIATCDSEGNQISGPMPISSEIRMHLEIYKLRSDVQSVVHAHPPTATGFAVAGIELTKCILPEVIVSLGGIPLADYGTPGGPDIVEPMKELLKDYDAILMANHGVVTIGSHVMDAHFKMETVEHFAKILLVAQQLGGSNTLSNKDVNELIDLRKRFGIVDRPSCGDSDSISKTNSSNAGFSEEIIEEITQEVINNLRS